MNTTDGYWADGTPRGHNNTQGAKRFDNTPESIAATRRAWESINETHRVMRSQAASKSVQDYLDRSSTGRSRQSY